MSLAKLEFSEAFYSFIKNNCKNIVNVEDILRVCDSSLCKLEKLSEINDELYINMAECKRLSQLLLNLCHFPNEYKGCKIAKYDTCSNNRSRKSVFDIDSTNLKKIYLVEMICSYVKYHQMIQDKEREMKTGHTEEESELLLGSICCYCNEHMESNIKYCNVCESDGDDMKAYARNHYNTLKLKYKKKESNFYQNMEKIKVNNSIEPMDSIPENFDTNSLKCGHCGTINKLNDFICEKCNASLIHEYINIEKEKDFNKNEISSDIFKTNIENIYEVKQKINGNDNLNNLDEWTCDKCGLLNNEDFCAACLNPRIQTSQWKCESCKHFNEFFNEKCEKCKLINRNIVQCQKCKIVKIPADREYCDGCFIKVKQWQCWYTKCNKLNDEKEMFCVYCKIQKYEKLIFFMKDKSEKFWACQSCHFINKYTNKVCKNSQCKQKFVKLYYRCKNCGKNFTSNECQYCPIKCPTCSKEKCLKLSNSTFYGK